MSILLPLFLGWWVGWDIVAVKCNDDPVLLKTLSDLGLGFDCSSKDEIRSVLEIGVRPHDIIYANPCKQASHLRYVIYSHNLLRFSKFSSEIMFLVVMLQVKVYQ